MKRLILDSFLAGMNFITALVLMALKQPALVLLNMVATGFLLWNVIDRYEAIQRKEIEP